MIFKDILSRQNFIFTSRFLLTAAKSPQTYLFRSLLIIILFISVLLFSFSRGTPSGLNLFKTLCGINFFYISVFSLKAFSAIITEEKEQGTLGLLMITPHHPISLIAAKAVPIFTEISAIFLIEMPLLLLCMTFGGISLEQVFQIFILLPAHALFIASFALFFSSYCKTTRAATSLAFANLVALFISPYLVDGILFLLFPGSSFLAFSQYFTWMNPIHHMSQILSFAGFQLDLLYYVLYTFANLFICLLLSTRKLQKMDLTTAANDHSTSKGKSSVKRKRRAWQKSLIGKDYQLCGGHTIMILKLLGYSTLCIALYFFMDIFRSNARPDFKDFTAFSAGICLVIGIVETYAYIGQVFTMEIKDKQLSALLTLPYSNEQIILKKIAASFLLSTVPFALATLFYISVPSRIPLLFDALSSPVFYLLACLFTFLYFTCMYNALIAKRKRSFIEQLKIIGITAACLLILIIPAIILLANYIVYGTLFVIVLTLIYSNVIFSKVSNWLTVLAQQEN